jgi:hypothetical protein
MFKKNYLLLFILACFFPCCVHAQYENVWVIGHLSSIGIGDKIDFNGAAPVVSPATYSSPGEGTASVCNANGQLLFYTEGDTVWNKNGVIMPNGKGLTGIGTTPWGYNATNGDAQGALIVPMPAHPGKYYIFSLTDQSYGPYLGHSGYLYYSVVDITLDGGNGDVVGTQKGIVLDSLLTEAMSGVAGNNCNIWITVGGLSAIGQASVFKSFELSATGLNTTPVVSTVTGPPLISGSGYESLTKFTFSPDRAKMVRVRAGHPNGLELFDFNAGTGVISNLRSVDSGSLNGYRGACFSADNSILYGAEITGRVFQFDMNNTSIAAITASKLKVDSTCNSEMKYAPDGKIYFAPLAFVNGVLVKYLRCINNPNVWGAGCMPGISSIVMPLAANKYLGFPNVVPITVRDSVYLSRNVIICAKSDSLVHVNDTVATTFLWNDGSTANAIKVTHSGTYWVKYGNYCEVITDTIVATLRVLAPVIVYNPSYLSTTISYSTYQWFKDNVLIAGATNNTYNHSGVGNYKVVVSDGTCTDTSAAYVIAEGTGIDDPELAARIQIFPNPATDVVYVSSPVAVSLSITSIEGKQIKKADHAKQISVNELQQGMYFLHVWDKNGNLIKVNKFIKSK